MENIFINLYKYKPQPEITPIENFFTESLKFVLSLDAGLLNKFVSHLAGETVFTPPFTLKSQVRYGNSIIDLEVSDKNYKKIFIEIKVNAHENRYFDEEVEDDFGQVEKYLRMNKGYVCFITKDQGNIEVKSHKDKFLGQFEWFEVYRLLQDYLANNKLNKTNKYFISKFLDFMSAQKMQPFAGFTPKDLSIAKTNFLDLYNKLLDFLNEINRDKRIIKFCRKYRLVPVFNTPKFDRTVSRFYLTLSRPEWRMNKQIEMGFELWKDGETERHPGGLYYYQGVYAYPNEFYEKFVPAIKSLKLKNDYFEWDLEQYWPLLKEIEFTGLMKQGQEQAITYIYDSLLELERAGVMGVLEKLK